MSFTSYDTIIVGAGSAGCVVAARLSEDPARRVLLLEAGGPDEHPDIRIPFYAYRLQRGPFDWGYVSEPQPGLGGRQIDWPRGRVLGGTSAINAMVYIRGHRRVFDAWAEAGNEGWSYEELLPLFRRAEHQERGEDAFHGVGGPLDVADLREVNPLSCAFVEAAAELGLPLNLDFNGAEQAGFGFYQVTQRRGERWSAASAYLRPALARPNLTVLSGAQATRILLRASRAVGVAFVQNGEPLQAMGGEVVLCGGAINSPQLLLLSGIGPAAQLRALGIPVAVDLPGVGQNLQDHLDVAVAYSCREPISLGLISQPAAELSYRHFRRGPLASGGPEAGGFLASDPAQPVPDLQYHFTPGWSVGFGVDRPRIHGFAIWPGLVLPASRGFVALRSPDPLAPPLIQPNYLSDARDLAVLVAGVRLGRRLAATRAFAPFVGEAIQPAPALERDDELDEYVRAHCNTIYHPVGTCKMGSDPLAVVDAELRVRGVEGLRVADASIMPTIVNGNTNAAAMVIGEKLATLLGGV
jgi:choline dehydrogenase